MPRRRPKELVVEMGGAVVAVLHESRSRREIQLRHTDEILGSVPVNARVLSCSLPATDQPQPARQFLDGYLPEGEVRSHLAAARGIVASDTWMMLTEYGRDIAGAMSIVAAEAEPSDRSPGMEPYSADSFADAVANVTTRPLDIHDNSELSLAGVQSKLLLVRADDGSWARPTGGLPSTHICKPEPYQHPGLVQLERDALELANAAGLTTVEPSIEDVGGRPCLIVTRYDRQTDDDGIVVRVHQEDLCQATGRDPHANGGKGKYERHGGPGFKNTAELLWDHAEDPRAELDRLIGAMVFTVLIGNSDAHGKNLSFLHDATGRISLAPLYDTVPTMLMEHLNVRCAMWINSVQDSLESVSRDDLIAEVAGRGRWRLPEETVEDSIDRWMDEITLAAHGFDGPVGGYVASRAAKL